MDKKEFINKKITFSAHAKDRIKQRELSEEWVLDIIRNHQISFPIAPDNTQELRTKREGTYYYVVIKHRESDLLVITAGEAEYEKS